MGHTSWFFEAMFLNKYIPDYKPFHPDYAFVFNSYYESFGERVERPQRGSLSRPTVEEIVTYRSYLTERMCELIEKIEEPKWPGFSEIVVLALNHEQQHQELLITDIKYILANNPLRPIYSKNLERHEGLNTNPNLPESKHIEYAGGLF